MKSAARCAWLAAVKIARWSCFRTSSQLAMDAVLASLDRTQWCGRRDYALLLTMYNAGARVSEIATLRHEHVTFGPTSYVQLYGKGRKERSIPLWPKTARILKEWFHEINARDDSMAFPNVRRAPMTRFAIHLLLRKAVLVASTRCPSLARKRVSPHVIRHGTAMALLQAGADLAVIAVCLDTKASRRPMCTSTRIWR